MSNLEVKSPSRSNYVFSEENHTASDALSSSPVHKVLKANLPTIASVLGVQIDELTIINYIRNASHMCGPNRDLLISQTGLVGIPYIITIDRNRRNGVNHPVGNGIHLYEIKGDLLTRRSEQYFWGNDSQKNYRYVSINIPSADGGNQFYIMKKGEVAHLIRYFHRMRINSIKGSMPILHDGLLEKIMKNSINFLRADSEYKNFGVKAQRGLVFTGEPGNGKTMTCKYIKELAAIHNINIESISAGELENAYSRGQLPYMLNREGILFLDDIDISFFNRKGDGKMACSMLSAMDGIDGAGSSCVRIFTTNETIQDMDDAFKRPGRIDNIFSFDKPNREMRKKFLHTWPKEIQESINEDIFLNNTDNFSFAECESLKTIMVTNYLSDKKEWDFDKALQDYKERTGEHFEKRRVGFSPN